MSEFVNNCLEVEPHASANVLRFIEQFLGSDANRAEVLRNQFRSGYCWHFAHMLRSTFGFGTVALAYPFGHFVWFGSEWIPYDVEGVYQGEADYFVPDHLIKNMLLDFKHIPGKSISSPESVLKDTLSVINRHCRKDRFDVVAWLCNLSERDKDRIRLKNSLYLCAEKESDFQDRVEFYISLAEEVTPKYFDGSKNWRNPMYKKFINMNEIGHAFSVMAEGNE